MQEPGPADDGTAPAGGASADAEAGPWPTGDGDVYLEGGYLEGSVMEGGGGEEEEEGAQPAANPNTQHDQDGSHAWAEDEAMPQAGPSGTVQDGEAAGSTGAERGGPGSSLLRDAAEAGGRVYVANLAWWSSDADLEELAGEWGRLAGPPTFVEERSNGRSKVRRVPGTQDTCGLAARGLGPGLGRMTRVPPSSCAGRSAARVCGGGGGGALQGAAGGVSAAVGPCDAGRGSRLLCR
jgi:hypothetical protein